MPFDDLIQQWPKRCSCGCVLSESDWLALPEQDRAILGGDVVVETRRCECGEHLAVVTKAE